VLYLLFGDNNIFENHKLNTKIRNLEVELQHYNTMLSTISSNNTLSPIVTKEEREEYFRKHHHLKKENEDIFRIVYNEQE
jgi:hypothetical protein